MAQFMTGVVCSTDFQAYFATLKRLARRLRDLGYEFSYPSEVLPGPVATSVISEFEGYVGPLPSSLRSFYSTVGSVNFIGDHLSWNCDSFPDPIYVSDFGYILSRAREYAENQEEREWFEDCYGGFVVELAPDSYHKADVSGGECYHIKIPDDPDPCIHGLLTGPQTLCEYLADVLDYGGFPGLKECEHNWPLEELRRITSN